MKKAVPAQALMPRGKLKVGGEHISDRVYRFDLGYIWQALRAEPWFFWLFCGYLFFEYVRPQGIYPAIDVLPWAKLLVLGSMFMVLASRGSSKSIRSPISLPLLGFFAVAFLSMLFAYDREKSFEGQSLLINWIILYLLFLWIPTTKFRFFIVMLLLFLASFKMAQFGAIEWARRGFSYTSWGVAGPEGYFQNAADLGVQMAIYTPWAVAFYFGCRQYWKSRIIKFLFLFACLAGVATAFATGQRNSALAFVAMAACFVLFTRGRFRNLLVVGVLAAGVVAFLPDEYLARFDTAGEDQTSQSRLTYWSRGLEIYADNPVIGVGYNNWTVYYARYYPGESLRTSVQEVAHSVPITIAAEMGTLGLLFYYWLVVTIFLVNIRSARAFREGGAPLWRYFALSFNFGMVGFLSASIFLSITFYPFLWVQAGLSAALYKLALNHNSGVEGSCDNRAEL